MRSDILTYSRKVFLPLTHLCRDVCHYCTFAKPMSALASPYMKIDDILSAARKAQALGCKEALLTLGERPELRWRAAREALDEMGFASTIDFVAHVAELLVRETNLLPHVNAGTLSSAEIRVLRRFCPSMGMMLESISARLCEVGGPHHGSPDKNPESRLETLRQAGEAKVPFTTGLLIGIGETRAERIDSLTRLKEIHDRYGHLQEIIIQSFRAKAGTRMENASEPNFEETLWTVRAAKEIFGETTVVQVPPNLTPEGLVQLVEAGVGDWGGISPLTPDYVNPEAPWPHVSELARQTSRAGKQLAERLTIYPRYALAGETWLDPTLRGRVLSLIDADGLAREDEWVAGVSELIPRPAFIGTRMSPSLVDTVDRAMGGEPLPAQEIAALFSARGEEARYVCHAADELRRKIVGDAVTYVVNRNINYTNVCTFGCRFCAFSKGRPSDRKRDKSYNLEDRDIAHRVTEAHSKGATEICLQGGIHPRYDGQTYLRIVDIVKSAAPEIHVHAFSPLEVQHGARSLRKSVRDFLLELKSAGLGSLPGTAAEILDDEVREIICPQKLKSEEWLEIVDTAHEIGLPTTATIMFGHVDHTLHWGRHFVRIRDQQMKTGGFTEFVPLPFVAAEAPIFRAGRARKGPTYREALLMHAVARLTLGHWIPNIQASWVKMGEAGVLSCLAAGANDFGGTLMNESITRAAGASHGEEMPASRIEAVIRRLGREPRQRSTLYGEVTERAFGGGQRGRAPEMTSLRAAS